MPSETVIAAIVIFGTVLIYCAVILTIAYRTMRDIERMVDEAIAEESTPPTAPVLKLPRLSRRMPEPEPGGTKVYPNAKEAWDEGLERTDV